MIPALNSQVVVTASGKVVKKRGDEVFTIPLTKLTVDPDYQRTLNRARVERMAREWDERLAGALVVSAREDGTNYVVDGQHRYEAARIMGKKSYLCFVFAGLSREEEADLFVELNTVRKAVRSDDRFRARVVAKDKVALAIVDVAEQHGFTVLARNGSKLTDIMAAGALEVIYTRYGDRVLAATLRAIRDIWPGEKMARQADVIGGIGLFLGNYLEDAVWTRLVERMGRVPAAQLLREAKGMLVEIGKSGASQHGRSGVTFGTAQVMVARLIRDYYNRGLRKPLSELKTVGGKRYPIAPRRSV